jgi:hypothetical protein
MATFTHEPRSYGEADEVFRSSKQRGGKVRLGNETYLYRHQGCYIITLFGNEVVRFHDHGLKEYKTCGWITASTIDRLNAFTPSKFSISGRNYTRRAKSYADAHLLIHNRETGQVERFDTIVLVNQNDSIMEVR